MERLGRDCFYLGAGLPLPLGNLFREGEDFVAVEVPGQIRHGSSMPYFAMATHLTLVLVARHGPRR
jgi:hypothetical protein